MRNILILFMLCGLAGLMGCASAPSTPAEQETESPAITLIRKLLPESPQQKRQKLMERLASSDADQRREGVLMLGDKESSQWDVTPRILSIMAQGDPNPQVRTAAVGVLSQLDRPEELMTTLAATARDDSPQVRRETLRALTHLDNPEVSAILRERLKKDPEATLRSEAAKQLKRFSQEEVVPALITALSDTEFSVLYEARHSLIAITGEDFGYDAGAWRDYRKGLSPAEL